MIRFTAKTNTIAFRSLFSSLEANIANSINMQEAGRQVINRTVTAIRGGKNAFGRGLIEDESGDGRALYESGALLRSFNSRWEASSGQLVIYNNMPYSGEQNDRQQFLDVEPYVELVANLAIGIKP